jgi:hypothetical protein
VNARRRVRINVELPEFTPAQADFLWTFLENLASDLWDAYEQDLLDLDDARFRLQHADPETTETYDDPPDDDDARTCHPVKDQPDPDF